MSKRQATLASIALAALVCSLLAVPASADSQVRIVRLSDVQGDVQLDRNTGDGYEKAFVNSPIVTGAKLRTSSSGRAEVEFEDGSTLRIAPRTVIEFTELSRQDSGTSSVVEVHEGTAYVNFVSSKDNQFTLAFGREKVVLKNPAHLRLEMGETDATLAVFKGAASIESPAGTVEVGKNQSATFAFNDRDNYQLAKNLDQDPYDAWDRQENEYHQQHSNNSYSPYTYGVSDLNYYGSFFDAPGYGTLWQPYFAGAGWDPFMNGAWLWYPGFGYTWVSSYPWGWMPYRYGSWLFLPGRGWVWQPGRTTSWAGWNTGPAVLNPPNHFTLPHPPVVTNHGTVVVGRGAGTVGGPSRRLTIQNDSAGLGIPRGAVGHLEKLSQQVRQDGSATTRVHSAPVSTVAPMSTPQSSSRGVGSAGSNSPARSSPAPRSAPAPAPHAASGPRGGPK